MQSSGTPKKLPIPFASSGEKQDIPITTSAIPGRASYTDGFPSLTRTPLSAGGIPPFGTDFNGILSDITAAIRWSNAGMTYTYDSSFSSSVNGYPKGAKLTKLSLDGVWLNTVEGNMTNPDTGGTGWVDMTSGRLINIKTFTSSSTYIPSQGVRSVIIYCQGAGGAGGGAAPTTATTSAPGGGGGSGALAVARLNSGFSGASVVIGNGGTGVGNAAGGNGGASSFGASITAGGGQGGARAAAFTPPLYSSPGPGGAGISGANLYGKAGDSGTIGICFNPITAVGGIGAQSTYGGGGNPVGVSSAIAVNGKPGSGYGAGGSGGVSAGGAGASAGGNGSSGIVLVYEYS